MKYEILEHKADIKIKVFGETLEELFRNAVWAMASILKSQILSLRDISRRETNLKFQKLKLKKTLLTKSADREILLIDFLNDILGESQINQAVYPEVKFVEFHLNLDEESSYLKAEINGYPVERFDEDIKAVTYHDLKIQQNKKGTWEAIILFDV